MDKLTPKQQQFVDEYLIDLNATQAAIRAGYSIKNADKISSQLMGKTRVKEAIKKRMEDRQNRTKVTADRVLKEYAKIAFCDTRMFFNENGTLRPVSEWTEEMAACVGGLDVIETGGGSESTAILKKVKLIDRRGALDSLARHLGMFKDKVEIEINEPLAERLMRAKNRAESDT